MADSENSVAGGGRRGTRLVGGLVALRRLVRLGVLGGIALDLDDARRRLGRRDLAAARRLGHHVAADAHQLAVAEVDHQATLLGLAVPWLEAVDVVPAIGMEQVGDQWRTEDETHLVLALAR